MPVNFGIFDRYKYGVVLLFVFAFVVSLIQLRTSFVDLLPEHDPPQVEIQTEALGLSAEEVEALITVPMEVDLMNGVSWVDKIQSKSMPGLSSVLLTFEEGTNLFRARQMVQERMTQAHALPNVSKPPIMMQPRSSIARVMQIELSSETLSLVDLSVLARWNLRPRLLGVPGVANIAIWGQRQRQLQILVDPEELSQADLTVDQIVSTSGNALWYSPLTFLDASSPGSGGFIDTPNQRLTMQHLQPISTPEQLSKVVIEGSDKTLAEVATIVESHLPVIGDAVVEGERGLILVVEKFPWADTVEVTKALDNTLAAIKQGLPEVNVDTSIFRPASYLESARQNIIFAVIFGLVLAALCIFVVESNWQRAMTIVCSAAISIIVSAGLVNALLGGLDLVSVMGIFMATGIVFTSPLGVVASALRGGSVSPKPVGADLFSGVALILLAGPLLFLGGLEGALTLHLYVAFAISCATTVVVSSLLPPALLYSLPDQVEREVEVVGDNTGLSFVLEGLKLPVLASTAVLALIGLFAFSTAERSLSVSFEERDVLVRWKAPVSTSTEELHRLASRAVADIKELPGVVKVSASIGRAITSDRVQNVNSADIWVQMDGSADYDEMIQAIAATSSAYPGIESQVLNYSEDKMRSRRGDSTSDRMTVRVYGYEADQLEDIAQQLVGTLSSVQAYSDLRIVRPEVEPVIQVKVNLKQAESHGLKPGDIRRASAILLAGLEVGSLFEQQKVFDVVVWGKPDLRHSLSSVENLPIRTPSGSFVSLSDVAEVKVASMPTFIEREAASRYLDIVGNLSSGTAASAKTEISTVLEAFKFPLEFHAEILNDSVESEQVSANVRNAILATLLGLVLLAQAAFGSWRLALGVLLATLASLSGGFVVVAIMGDVILAVLAGIIAATAIAIPFVFARIYHYQSLERKGQPSTKFIFDFKRRENLEAMLPVATSFAFIIPLLLMSGASGVAVLSPMAWVLLGALITTLIVGVAGIPFIYHALGVGSSKMVESLFADRTVEKGGESYAK